MGILTSRCMAVTRIEGENNGERQHDAAEQGRALPPAGIAFLDLGGEGIDQPAQLPRRFSSGGEK